MCTRSHSYQRGLQSRDRRPQGQGSGPLRTLPLFADRVARLGCRDSPSEEGPTSGLRVQRASWPPCSGQEQGAGSLPGRPPSRAPSPRRAPTLRRASDCGGGGVPGGEGAQQRAHRRRPAGAPPAPAAHPAGGPLGAASAGPPSASPSRGLREAGRAGGGAAAQGRPLRRAGAPRASVVTLISPDPDLRRSPGTRDLSARDALETLNGQPGRR